MKFLKLHHEGNIHELNIKFNQKVNYLSKKYLSYLDRYSLNMRYFHDVKLFDFYNKDLKKDYRKPVAPVCKVADRIPISF